MVKRNQNALFRILVLTFLLLVPGTARAVGKVPAQPSREDKCPVCGMFVYKYPDWLAGIAFSDGLRVFFDGAKDLFKYYFDMNKYGPARSRKDIESLFVREYYDMDFLDARKAFFVTGSDVYGPMGHELIPLATMEDARTFLTDHKGRRILTFEEVTPEVVRALD